MLTQELDPQSQKPVSTKRPSAGVSFFLVLVFLGVLVLRHDFWGNSWDTPGYLLFGFLPQGLWWQGLVSLLACGMMWLMVRLAWPGWLEVEANQAEKAKQDPSAPHNH